MTTTIDLDGTSLVLDDEGTGPPTILLLHGFAANRASWAMLRGPLAERARVLTVDRPGWGASGLPEGDEARRRVPSPAGEARLWLDVADDLGAGPLVVVGHSAGGAVAAEVALAAPDRVVGLVLLDAAIAEILGPPASALALARRPDVNAFGRRVTVAAAPRAWRWFLGSTYQQPARVPAEILDAYGEAIAGPAWVETMWEMARLVEPDDLHDRVRDLEVPTLVVSGRQDRMVPPGVADHLAELIPRAHLVLVDDAGHCPHEEQPAEVLAAVEAFLDLVRPAGLPA